MGIEFGDLRPYCNLEGFQDDEQVAHAAVVTQDIVGEGLQESLLSSDILFLEPIKELTESDGSSMLADDESTTSDDNLDHDSTPEISSDDCSTPEVALKDATCKEPSVVEVTTNMVGEGRQSGCTVWESGTGSMLMS